MNYLTEHKAFMAWVMKHPLSTDLQSYWQWLLYFNNESAFLAEDNQWYWPVAFTAPNTLLTTLLNFKGRREIVRQRGYLCRRQLVEYQNGQKGKAGKYTLIPFDKGLGCRQITSFDGKRCDKVWDKGGPYLPSPLSPYINNINNKHASLYCSTPDTPQSPHGFNVPPPLSDAEREALKHQYAGNKLGYFYAEQAARKLKQLGDES